MERIVLFAKRPDAGRVKTRLERSLGREGAVGLYRALLGDTLDRLVAWRDAGRDVELCLDRSWEPPEPRHAGLRRTAQGPGDLGDRLVRTFRRAENDRVRATVVLGADAPTLPSSLVESAFRELRRGADAVVGPAEDGGYVLIGAVRAISELFRDVPWGGPDVLARTLLRARDSGVVLVETGGWYDVDDDASLARLVRELRTRGRSGLAPRTEAWLRSGPCSPPP